MTNPVTTTRTTCPVCGDIDAEVTFVWTDPGAGPSRQLRIAEFACRNGCSLDEPELPEGQYGPTTTAIVP